MKLFDAFKRYFRKPARQLLPDKTSHASPTSQSKSIYQGSLDVIKQLIPLGELNEKLLLEMEIHTQQYAPGAIIFNRGETADSLIYVLSGEVYLETSGKQNVTISAGTFDAYHPLASGEYRSATAICKKTAEVIFVPRQAMDLYQQQCFKINPERLLEVPGPLRNNTLLKKFIAADNVDMPALPDVALKLRQAMQKDLGVAEVVKIVNLDPSISAKLIQVANSPIYRTLNPITTCHHAVNRIGLHSTKNIVTSISLRSLYQFRRSELTHLAQKNWKQSIYISALSYTLANATRACDPDEALLAGLTVNIGVVPFLRYADNLPDSDYNSSEIHQALTFVTGALSTRILEKWNFPKQIKNIPLETQSWYFSNGGKNANLADIVRLAKYHSLLSGGTTTKLPPITSLPSYAHLQHDELTPDKSLKILLDAKQQINDTMKFFNA